MIKKVKLCTYVFLVIAIFIFMFGCGSTQVSKSKEKAPMTIDEVKKNYKEGSIKEIKEFGGHYVIVESVNEVVGSTSFELYNLETRDKDYLPTLDYKAFLDEIPSENDITFLANGECFENNSKTFPFLIRCMRNSENSSSDIDFYSIHEKLYLKTNKIVSIGKDIEANIPNVKLSLEGIEILFEPAKGAEEDFFAAYTDIPLTHTEYISGRNQLLFKFANSTLGKEILNKKQFEDNSNLYFKSAKFIQSGKDVVLIIDLKNTETTYNVEVNRLNNDLPYARITFK